MPRPAGEYSSYLTWFQKTTTTNEDNGEDIVTHVNNGPLFGVVEITGGKREGDHGAIQTGVYAIIRIRNYPAVMAEDILRDDGEGGIIYRVETVYADDDQIVCECYTNDVLVDYVLEEGS
jgi:hypothetical protein